MATTTTTEKSGFSPHDGTMKGSPMTTPAFQGNAAPSYAPPAGPAPTAATTTTYAPPSAPPPTYIKDISMRDTTQYNNDADLLAACKSRGISPYFATQLHRLREYAAVRLVIDDSGSMKAMMKIAGQMKPTTRWMVLQSMVREIFDLLTIARGREPIDVYFLNRLPGGMKANSVTDLQGFFVQEPAGRTPTLDVMQRIMTPEHLAVEEGVLTLLITDGAPDCGHRAFRDFLTQVQRNYPASYITVGICTDDQPTINEYEVSLDNGVPHLDVMSAYEDELREIREVQGRKFTFTVADWTVKFLLGSRVTEWDALDERKLSRDQLKEIQKFGNAYMGVGGGAGGGQGGGSGKQKKDCVIM
ncbi:hypothetical protein QFC22_005741 [Naganishia vaughanmartiniae]|uniref:Uncharacterized protein n=1 Tax=Naganishia vaughanmartiniae TaxID=1424756 RepID=A0ACC2WT03_9TREE|nr:hypothetical protein QFC22_005741 [Naganishia vaughanmartiniae]